MNVDYLHLRPEPCFYWSGMIELEFVTALLKEWTGWWD